MMLEHYLSQWHLSQPTLLAETATSHVYVVQAHEQALILKILTPLGIRDEQNGIQALRYFDGKGAVRVWHSDQHAMLLDYASGDDLVGMVQRGEDTQANDIIADVLLQLHQAKNPQGLRPLADWFRSLFTRVQQNNANDNALYSRGAEMAQRLLANPQDECVLHGDIHHANIRHHPQRGWLAFDPKGVFGERTYDVANVFYNPLDMDDLLADGAFILRRAQHFSRRLNISMKRILSFTFAYGCLSASWSVEDGYPQDAIATLNLAERIEGCLKHL
jgi:streptomycin 6-kinase